MMTVEDWAEIRRLHAQEQLSIRAIAKHLGIARDTVARAVVAQRPPQYVRPPVVSRFDAYEPRVRELLKDFPTMPATVIAERVGWDGSASWFRKRVAGLRVDYAPRDPADRLEYRPGDQAQCDLWFPPVKIPLGSGQCGTPPVLVIVSSYSRFITAMMLPSRTTGDLLTGMWELMSSQLGAVPHRLIWDNEAGIGRRNRYAEGVAGFCGTLATRIVQLRPFDPESKGIVERANGYLETSFLPGRTFTSPADFNTQLTKWLPVANARIVRRLGARPVELAGIDRAAMLALPPMPPATGFSARVRLPRDYYVRVAGNDYSVDPVVIGRMVEVHADLTSVGVTCDGRAVATHRRCWATAQTITDPDHVATARRLRQAILGPPAVAPDPMLRDLADYDTAFGVDLDPRAEADGQVA
ncbi:IS21 family transposase [Nocardioides piscis]|uniref:IS21 family transposase n=1 Tax=Nocardioides piscis TaxID=2714938 RepID=A0A6G7YDJ0_9ACTN|nr:IS21 family transposase [Nocardioides piscis]QIK74746.1 IS21 family transposase [Nocardioides piscis]